ncbi:MAG: aspartate/glutamate racemase family protein, partial [Eubacteriales bacterium]|nr:aspartate/glutamate racemase family protein [Eubacteriales bacterium]
YGDRTAEEVLDFSRQAIQKLISMDCKAIVIACNTATSAAANVLRDELSLPIIGMEPALKPAALLPGEGNVLVMATAMTLKLPKFRALMTRYGQHAVPVPCPGLVELIEAGETDGPRIRSKLAELLSPYLTRPVKAVVLGCTHYVFLKPALRAYLPPQIALVDGNEGTVRQLKNQLLQRGLLNTSPAVQATDTTEAAPERDGKLVFLSTSPDPDIPVRMREWFRIALRTMDEQGE